MPASGTEESRGRRTLGRTVWSWTSWSWIRRLHRGPGAGAERPTPLSGLRPSWSTESAQRIEDLLVRVGLAKSGNEA